MHALLIRHRCDAHASRASGPAKPLECIESLMRLLVADALRQHKQHIVLKLWAYRTSPCRRGDVARGHVSFLPLHNNKLRSGWVQEL